MVEGPTPMFSTKLFLFLMGLATPGPDLDWMDSLAIAQEQGQVVWG